MKQTVSFTKNATNIFFHILTRCNLNCRHCYINPAQHGKDTLPYETIEKWLTTFISAGKEANVVFLGGEPSLHPDLSLCIKKARALGCRSITVDINGYLFNDILAKVTPQEVDYFSFSLDGATEEMNDRIRGTGSFRQCLAGIQQAVSKGFKTSLIYTVSRTNIGELENVPRLLNELGIDRFFIQVIGIRGKAADRSLEKINECDLFRLDIPEGCVMNKIIQPDNLSYNQDGSPAYKIACCLLKEEIQP